MFLNCEIPECGTGGPVIDHDGLVTGLAFHRNPDPAIIGISTILTCIEMWTQFRSVARPVLDMHLRTVELLDISLQEQLSIQHNINRDFIVDRVTIDSTAERLGIRQGDVIVLDELCGSTLPQLEDFLLSHGWEYLRLLRNIQSHLMVDLKLEVHDLLGRAKRNVTLTVGISDASERVMKNWNKHDSRREVSTLSSEFDPDTAAALHSLQDRNMALAAACSIVSVSSTRAGDDNVLRCTGIVVTITSNEAGKCARILTSSRIFCSGDAGLHLPEKKVFVHLSDATTVEGHILFLNIHYRIAVLEILTQYPLQHVCFGDMPQYGQEVYLLGRDEECSIVVRRGSISLLEHSFLRCNYYMFLSCESGALQDLDCTGGLVLDNYGNMVGMIVAHNLQVAIMSITTVKTCIDMLDKFSRIARSMIDMNLRSVELLEIEHREKLSVHYNIKRGFIVNKVRSVSSAWRNVIREGDVMEIIDGECGSTLPQLEDYLLKLGWGCLDKSLAQLSTIDLKIRVHDIIRRTSKGIVVALEYDLV
uniref:Uncharacterized protein n=1 Tax=Avena sativa TaxID=4498 RepID=A0ACD5X3L9_AVESA